MKTIAIIIPYFGKFRNDFLFWLKSAEYNSKIDFFLFTDQTIINPPQNVIVIRSSLEEIEVMAKQYVWEGCILQKPYKLCDFRPAYGEMFHKFLDKYDFWGHCDIDLVFGDIKHFLNDDILDSFDRILVNGHLTLYRNNAEINGRYKRVTTPNYKEIFSTNKQYCFDEWGGGYGTSWLWTKNYSHKTYRTNDIEDVLPLVYKFCSDRKRKEDRELKRRNLMYSFDHGKLYRLFEEQGNVYKEEVMYVHFQKRYLTINTDNSERFSIIPNRYIDFVENVDIGFLRRNIRESSFWPYCHRVINKVLRCLKLADRPWAKKYNLVIID